MDAALSEKLKTIVLVVLDVDGVLTDGKIIIDDLGNESKHFHVRDGHGLKLLMRGGIDVALLTGRTSEVVNHRARDLGITTVCQGAKDKAQVLAEMLAEKHILHEHVAYVGDDIVDVPAFRMVGFSAAVADAPGYVKAHADYITEKKGGDGAVREICEMILKAQGTWDAVTEGYGLKTEE